VKNSIKNLYLPGTNKNVGYLDKNTMHIYKRHRKYYSFPLYKSGTTIWGRSSKGPIFLQKENKIEKNVQLTSYEGYIYNADTNMYDFYNCTFTTPDNLDVIEMAYLYTHWKPK
jgi:hypothetical protein